MEGKFQIAEINLWGTVMFKYGEKILVKIASERDVAS